MTLEFSSYEQGSQLFLISISRHVLKFVLHQVAYLSLIIESTFGFQGSVCIEHCFSAVADVDLTFRNSDRVSHVHRVLEIYAL